MTGAIEAHKSQYLTDVAGEEPAYEVVRDGKSIAGAFPHPRIIGWWLAIAPPLDWRDSGMKKFRTRRGAVAFVDRRLAALEAKP